jgi:subtilisin family serine protease
MRCTRRSAMLGLLAVGTLGLAGATATANSPQRARDYVVVYQKGQSVAAAHAAIARAGGRIVSENRDIGVAMVRSKKADFVNRAGTQRALVGAATNRPIGQAPAVRRPDPFAIERLEAARRAQRGHHGVRRPKARGPKAEPLAGLQWDMQMIHATASESYADQQGSHKVRVGIIDTGVDGSHPDIAPNFDRKLSRNFTVDDPIIDGTCDTDPDGMCTDPPDVDEDGHGTHVAGTIGAAINGLGMAGVAPRVDIVNLRAGQDSGYFFLGPTTDALTYAGNNGIDVVNMSFYIDPWLFNCRANPADSPVEQHQQQVIIDATQRALDYAHSHGVTLIAAEGNENMDLGKPVTDTTSPDYPDQDLSPHPRTIDNSCLDLPTEGNNVIGVTALGPSKRKAYYSSYGLEQADVSAPGGDAYDYPGAVPPNAKPENLVLAPYPQSVAEANGDLNPDGTPNNPFVVRDCRGRTCAYYQYLQGTSMASPHAVGVAALAVAQFGTPDGKGGVGLDPGRVEQLLQSTATDTPCPTPNPFVYPDHPDAAHTALCEGTPQRNGFYGDGIVDAERILLGR